MTSHHVDALEVPCPHCLARHGHLCVNPRKIVLQRARHYERHELAIHVEQMLAPSTSIAGHHDTDQEHTVTKPFTLTVHNPHLGDDAQPESFRKAVGNVLAAHWPDIEVTIPTSNAGQQRETLTEAQLAVLTAGRKLLGLAADDPETQDYRTGVLELMSLQMFGDPDQAERVTTHLDPWPPVDDTTLAAFGWAVVKALRETPPDGPLLANIIEAAAASQIVFQI